MLLFGCVFSTMAHGYPCTAEGQAADCQGPIVYPYWYIFYGAGTNKYWTESDGINAMVAYYIASGACSVTVPDIPWVDGTTVWGIPSGGRKHYDPNAGTGISGIWWRTGNPPCNTPSSSDNLFQRGRDIICPVKYTAYRMPSGNYVCQKPTYFPGPEKNLGCPVGGGGTSASAGTNPIHIGIGNKCQIDSDISLPTSFALSFVRTYNSIPAQGSGASSWPLYWTGGAGWTHSYSRALLFSAVAGAPGTTLQTAFAYRPDGKVFYFLLTGSTWVPDADINESLTQILDGGGNPAGWMLRTSTDEFETYDVNGRLVFIANRTGQSQSLQYDAGGKLASVSDTFGRSIVLGYNTAGMLASIVDPGGYQYQYGYAGGNLSTVTYPDTKVRTYYYNELANTENTAGTPYALTGIGDENGSRYATFKWMAWQYKPLSSEHAGGVDKYSVTLGTYSSVVTDPFGVSRTYTLQSVNGASRVTAVTQPCDRCGPTNSASTFDANANVASNTDFNSKKVCYVYDLSRNLETARAEGILSSETCSTVLATLPSRADVRKVSTQWHAIWRLPTTVAEPNRITTNAYNGDGGVYCAPTTALVAGNPIGVLCKKTVQETTDTTGQQGFVATLTGTPRVWQYTYDSYGQVLTATDPNNQTITTVYYAANDPDLGKRGNVQTITNPLGHVTTITAYDLNGRPLSITDPNGVVTTLTYHPRGWLTSRTVSGEQTTYDYDGVGQLTKVTMPDSSYIQYTYDGAHRLTQLQDGLGNKIVYTLDAMGNRIKEEARDPSNNLARTRQQVYDSLNRLHQTVGAQ